MPYSPKFERALAARRAGQHMRRGSLNKISPEQAGAMLSEAEGQDKSEIGKAAQRLKRRKR